MRFDNLLINIGIIVLSLNIVQGFDILNPSQLGESMDMPLPQELIQQSIQAGIIKVSSQANTPSSSSVGNLGVHAMSSDPKENSGSQQTDRYELNVSGTLSLILQDKSIRYSTLELRQSDRSISGRGNITTGITTQDVAASGSVENGKLSLALTSMGNSEKYNILLQPEGNTLKGSYEADFPDGANQSGTAIGIIVKSETKLMPTALAPMNSVGSSITNAPTPTATGSSPLQLGTGSILGSTFSSSKSISMSNSGGSMVSSSSSMNF